jgi:hypothetical protein
MKLQELVTERYHDDFDDRDDDRFDRYDHDDSGGGSGTFTIKEYDGVQPDDAVVSMFNIDVEYTAEDQGYTDHPYGMGTAREEHGVEVEVTSAVTGEEVTYHHPETDEIMKTFPKGTPVEDLPGWEQKDWDYVQDKAEDHAVS